jgi:AbrB family looped-hinge helix DNA binding protein
LIVQLFIRLKRMGESNGLTLWIPANIVRKLDLKPGERVLLVEKDGKIIVSRRVQKRLITKETKNIERKLE